MIEPDVSVRKSFCLRFDNECGVQTGSGVAKAPPPGTRV